MRMSVDLPEPDKPSLDEVHQLTKIDKWFLVQIEQIVQIELDIDKHTAAHGDKALESLSADELRAFKKKGFSDRRLAKLLKTDEHAVRARRHALGVRPIYKASCARSQNNIRSATISKLTVCAGGWSILIF